MEFREREEIREAVEALIAATESKERGDILTHDEIKAVTGLDPYQVPLPQIMKKFRRHTEEERGIALWPEHTVGFKYLSKQEQLEMLPAQRLNRATRQVRRARKSVNAIPVVGLTAHQRRVRLFQSQALQAAEHEMRSRRGKQSAFLKGTATLPRPERAIARQREVTA